MKMYGKAGPIDPREWQDPASFISGGSMMPIDSKQKTFAMDMLRMETQDEKIAKLKGIIDD